MFLEILKIKLLFIGSILFGPLLAIYVSFFGDLYSLSQEYKFLQNITSEWELVLMFGLFWIGLFSMLSFWSAIKRFLNKPPKLEWWQTEPIYQIFVKSFYDSNNDGIGDLQGIIKKLDYIKSLGIHTLWITPIYPSDGRDGGYDITSFVDIDPVYGSMKDFDDLIEQMHKRGMYLLLDFIPNHTSNNHIWFQESCKDNDPNNPYRDYYIWYPSEDKVNPPNNWKSCFGGSAWTYNEIRKSWYLHQFLPEQPDLNLRCPEVKKEIENIIKYWIEEKNVDGFRIDAVKHFFESEKFENEPLIEPQRFKSIFDSNVQYDDLKHLYSANQPETYELLYEWRKLLDEISKRTNRTRVIIAEATYDVEDIGSYYWFDNKPNAHFALNMQLCFINNSKHFKLFKRNEADQQIDNDSKCFKPNTLKNLIEEYHKYLPENCWSNWELGNHDQKRIATRIGRENINLANALNLLIGGTGVVYYGEEIGMEDLPVDLLKFEDCQDQRGKNFGPEKFSVHTRDYSRTPMQWNSTKNAGFSNCDKTWLPVNPEYIQLNVQNQLSNEKSHLKIFKDLVQLRRSPSFQWGSFKFVVVNDQIFSFIRKAFSFAPFLVIMNLCNKRAIANLLINSDIAPRAYVAYYISGSNVRTDLDEKYIYKSSVLTRNIYLNPYDCLVLTWPSSD